MSLAADYLLGVGLAALVTASILRDHRHRIAGRLLWLAGTASLGAGSALNAVVYFGEHRPVHAWVRLGIAAVAFGLIADAGRRAASRSALRRHGG